MSYIAGTQQRILDLQQNSRHYFQRPDSKFIKMDSSATSLSGYSGRLAVNKQKGNIFLNTAIGVISPGFDVNDLGYTWLTNVINSHFVSGYTWTDPSGWYRTLQLGAAVFRS
jgi:hypothetical protein